MIADNANQKKKHLNLLIEYRHIVTTKERYWRKICSTETPNADDENYYDSLSARQSTMFQEILNVMDNNLTGGSDDQTQ